MRRITIATAALFIGAAPLAAQDINDANIAAIVVAANQADIDNGRLALEKSANERVRGFARQMVEAHTAVNAAAVELVTELGVTPEPNAISEGIATGQAGERERISKLKGAAFDRAYIRNEVAYHEAVLAAVDGALVPSAENDRLKQTLIDVRPAFVAHLKQAKEIEEALGS